MERQLLHHFGSMIEVDCVLIEGFSSYDFNGVDLIITSGSYSTIHDSLKRVHLGDIAVLFADRVINYRYLEPLFHLSPGEKVLIVNDHELTASELIDHLKELGFREFVYESFYPGKDGFEITDVVITPGESEIIPFKPQRIIDIHSRILSIRSLNEVIRILDLPLECYSEVMTGFLKDIVHVNRSLVYEQNRILKLNDVLIESIERIDHGIAYLERGNLTFCNNAFAHYLGKKKNMLIGGALDEFISSEEILESVKRTTTISLPIGKVRISGIRINFREEDLLLIARPTGVKNEEKTEFLYDFDDYVTADSEELKMLEKAKRFSKSESSVLIQGESGTGKEILAQAIHKNSDRKNKPFIPINITTLSNNLIESELFGYEKGSFTGGLKEGKRGIFELADGGTIFIDEIGDTPAGVQVQLLRVLEENTIRRIGSHEEIPINVRIISATNKNLLEMTETGEFRLDLFFRLNILPLETRPLRRKREDVILLVDYYLKKHLLKLPYGELFSEETMDFLSSYDWPGNIRELTNLLDYLFVIYAGEKIQIHDLQNHMLKSREIPNEHHRLSEEEYRVLLLYSSTKGVYGRIKASRLLSENGFRINEGKMRRLLTLLYERKLLSYIKNRGYAITEQGKRAVDEYGATF